MQVCHIIITIVHIYDIMVSQGYVPIRSPNYEMNMILHIFTLIRKYGLNRIATKINYADFIKYFPMLLPPQGTIYIISDKFVLLVIQILSKSPVDQTLCDLEKVDYSQFLPQQVKNNRFCGIDDLQFKLVYREDSRFGIELFAKYIDSNGKFSISYYTRSNSINQNSNTSSI